LTKKWSEQLAGYRVRESVFNRRNKTMRALNIITQLLLIVGGLNWLLVGLFEFDLVAALLGGQAAPVSRLVYIIVGLCAIWQLIRLPVMLDPGPQIAPLKGRGPSDPL
jgi:uncharacterized protein